jgi:hypothetical protein
MMSPRGRAFSACIRRTSTPDPAATGSTSMPLSLRKAPNTRSFSVLSLAV